MADRIQEVQDLADAAVGQAADDGLSLAASALNKAALIASDCGMPGLARDLCWRQAESFLQAKPLSGAAARYALEPLVNLVRLRIRAGEQEEAAHDLDCLWHGVKHREAIVLAGRPVALSGLTSSDEEHRNVCRWLWGVVLAEGVRALVAAGQWERAAAHAERHGGVGQRIMDGRQITIVACIVNGDPSSAQRLLAETTVVEPWEQAVVAALTAYCLRVDCQPVTRSVESMVGQVVALVPEPGLAVFHTRLGLAAVDIAEADEARLRIVDHLLAEALSSEDGYVARDILANGGLRQVLTDAQQRKLRAAMRSAHLERGYLPDRQMERLFAGVRSSEENVARTLQRTEGLRPFESCPAGNAR